MTVQTCIILLLLLQLLLPNPIVVKAEIPAFIVFGDSTVDSGNNNFIPTIAKSDFPPYGRDFPGGRPTGRFSNGRLATDFISEFLGLGSIVPAYLDPSNNISSLASGVCFASAGTGYDTVTTDLFKVIPMKKELEYYKEYQKRLRDSIGYDKANHILREALYLTSIGTNDFILNYFLSPIRQAQFTTEEFENYILGLATNFIRELYHLGARKFVMVSIPPIGCLPIVRTLNSLKLRDCIKEFNNVAVDVNHKLENQAAKLNTELPGLKLVVGDVYSLADQIFKEPSSFGFEDVGKGCCATGTFELGFLCNKDNPFTCEDASKYAFWDSVHPTERLYQIIANDLIKIIQETYY